MIYSNNIEKHCGICQYSKPESDDSFFCAKKKKSIPVSRKVCRRFTYDILKKQVRRPKRKNSQFTSEDFSLD